ncbi:MAG: COX15/CtaA family protein [Calditrichaceae bacterium]|nr:COX15/CtaA family protein [Calditrichaceae bacterium]
MNHHILSRFKILALLSTLITYFLIFVGGLVRVSGAGLGCPDWPKCFGRWIPPTSVDQLPADMDPNLFNFTLAWIEYINRLIGMITGLLIAATALYAIIHFRKYPKIIIPSIIAVFLVAVQGWQGGQVVASALEPFMITIHMFLAFIIVSLILYVYLQSLLLEKPELTVNGTGSLKIWLIILYLISIFQVVMGTQMRSGLEHLKDNFPMLSPLEWIDKLGPVNPLHAILGFIVAALAIYTTFKLMQKQTGKIGYFKITMFTLDILFILQIITGFILVNLGIPPLMQILHLWFSSLIIGGLLILISYSKIKQV